jgi:MscS family membrane protein
MLLASAVGARLLAQDQPQREPASQAVSQVAPPEAGDPLRSPYHAVQHFLVKVADATKNAAEYAEAIKCLDFSALPAEAVELKGPEYVDDLATVVATLRVLGQFDRERLPQEGDSTTQPLTFGNELLQVELARGADGRWRFSAATVEHIPAMIETLRARAEMKAADGQPGTPPAALATALRLDTSSPQATLNMFLTAMHEHDMASAVRCLDVSRLSTAQREMAAVLAGKLWLVFNRYEVIVLQDVPDDTGPLEPYAVLKHRAGRIEIDRKRASDREGEWLFTAATVHGIEPLYEAFEHKPILEELQDARVSFWTLPALYVREYVVPPALKRPVWGLQVWQWTGLVLAVLLAVLLRELCSYFLPRAARRLLRTEGVEMVPRAIQAALRPTATLTFIATLWGGVQFLDLGAQAMSWLWWPLKIGLAAAGVFACYRLIDLAVSYLSARVAHRGWRLEEVLLPLVHKTLRVVVLAFGFVFLAKAFGFEVAPLLAGLGLGGLAFGLAAQDTLKNFFGSVNVALDRPFHVGDWIKVGDVEGTVESVGLRSSRLRTAYDSLVTVPNSELMNTNIDNLGRRRYRRTATTVAVPYGTPPDQLEAFCEGIREVIRQHPCTRKDNFQVYVNSFGPSAIEIQVSCFHETPDWKVELRERHRLFLDIVRLARRLGIDFAYPTRTIIHVQPEEAQPAAPPREPAAPQLPASLDQAMHAGREAAAAVVAASVGVP